VIRLKTPEKIYSLANKSEVSPPNKAPTMTPKPASRADCREVSFKSSSRTLLSFSASFVSLPLKNPKAKFGYRIPNFILCLEFFHHDIRALLAHEALSTPSPSYLRAS